MDLLVELRKYFSVLGFLMALKRELITLATDDGPEDACNRHDNS